MSAVLRPALLGVALLCGPLLAAAQTLPGDRELARERQQQVLEEQRRRLDELQNLPGKAAVRTAPALVEDGQCVTLTRITVEGATLLSEAKREALLAPWSGRCLGVPQLNEVLKSLTDHYLRRGYVTTRAYLPQQDLKNGELKIIVVEGRLESLDSSALASSRELAMTFPGQVGEVLNLRELEQLVDQLARLPSRQAELELAPGEQVGGSRVGLQGERLKPWRVSATRNNDGDKTTGEQQMGVGLDWDSPLGLADQLSLRANRMRSVTAGATPITRASTTACPGAGGRSIIPTAKATTGPATMTAGFSIAFDPATPEPAIRAERVLHRDNLGKTGINFGLSHLRTRNYIDDNFIDVSSHRITEPSWASTMAGVSARPSSTLDIGWQQGIGALDAQGSGHPRGREPVSRYNKYTLTLSYLQPFRLGEKASVSTAWPLANAAKTCCTARNESASVASVLYAAFKTRPLGRQRRLLAQPAALAAPRDLAAAAPFVHEYGVGLGYDIGVIAMAADYNPDCQRAHDRQCPGVQCPWPVPGRFARFARSLERPA